MSSWKQKVKKKTLKNVILICEQHICNQLLNIQGYMYIVGKMFKEMDVSVFKYNIKVSYKD